MVIGTIIGENIHIKNRTLLDKIPLDSNPFDNKLKYLSKTMNIVPITYVIVK